MEILADEGSKKTKPNKANLLAFSVLRSADGVKMKKRNLKNKANSNHTKLAQSLL
jgi:hypothetical protein